MIRLALAAALVCAWGCSSEDPTEEKNCTSDGDADHLTDCEEQSLGTDPANADTDGDSYLDGDEILESKDPLDPESRIYAGYWPYQREKAAISDPGFGEAVGVDARIPRLVAIDQFGEEVDLYDFAGHGKPVVIDLSAVWCDACKELARWLEGEPSNLGMPVELDPVVDRVANGEVFWITVLFEDAIGNPAQVEEAKNWATAFPNAKVAVLIDDNRKLRDWFFPGAMPSVHAADDQLQLLAYDRFDYKLGIGALVP